MRKTAYVLGIGDDDGIWATSEYEPHQESKFFPVGFVRRLVVIEERVVHSVTEECIDSAFHKKVLVVFPENVEPFCLGVCDKIFFRIWSHIIEYMFNNFLKKGKTLLNGSILEYCMLDTKVSYFLKNAFYVEK